MDHLFSSCLWSTFVRIASCVMGLVVLFTGLTGVGKADLVLRVAQTAPAGNIDLGLSNAATFSVFLSSTVANQSFLGLDFTISLSSNTGAGGLMVAGTNDLLPLSSNPAGFFAGSFTAPGSFTANFSTVANNALTLQTTESLLATVTLSSVGATAGDYTVSLSQLDAIDGGFNQLAFSGTSTLSDAYSITAVPEPSSMLLTAIVGAGFMVRRRRRLLSGAV
jgi:hypothetical protein